jgi:hypothetical protein
MVTSTPPHAEPRMRLSAVSIVLGTTVSILFRMVSHMLTDQTVGTAFTNTLNECLEACDRTTSCVDVSYSSGTPGACYLKSSAGDIRRNSNIWGGRQLSGCTSQTSKLKLHRKRVVHKAKRDDTPIVERGFALGPDSTYLAPAAVTATRTAVVTSTVGTT